MKKIAIVFPIICLLFTVQIIFSAKMNLFNKIASGKQITNEFLPFQTASESGCYSVTKENKIFNVKNCGVKGDGVTDDSYALQAVIDSSSEGDVIFIPPGTYTLSKTVQFKKNRTYRGSGWTTILKRADNSRSDSIISIQPDGKVGHITISDFVLNGNKKNFSKAVKVGAGIKITGVTDSKIENIKVIENPGTGIWLDSEVGKIPVTNTHLINTWTYNNDGYGIYLSPSCMDLHVIGGDHGQNLYAGIYLNSPSSSVRDSIVWATRFGHGIIIPPGAPSVQIMNATLEGNALSGIYINSNHVLVEGCKIYANSNSTVSSDGIFVEGKGNVVENTMILNNAIYSRLYKDAVNSVHRYQINLVNHKNTSILGNSMLYNGSGEVNPVGEYVSGINETTKTDFSWVTDRYDGFIKNQLNLKPNVPNKLLFSSKKANSFITEQKGVYYPKYTGTYKIAITVPIKNQKKGNKYTLSIFKNGKEYKKLDIKKMSSSGMFLLKGSISLKLINNENISFAVYSEKYNDKVLNGEVNSDLVIEIDK